MVSFGIVSEPGQRRLSSASLWPASVIETDAQIVQDCIGGPLLDEGGAVIGMLVSYNSAERTGLAVSVDEIRLAVEELKTEGQVSRGSLGIVSRSVADLRSYEKSTRGLQLDAINGVLVTAAMEDSACIFRCMYSSELSSFSLWTVLTCTRVSSVIVFARFP